MMRVVLKLSAEGDVVGVVCCGWPLPLSRREASSDG